MIDILLYIILALFVLEFLLYFMKNWKIIKWPDNNFVKSIFNFGIPLYQDKLVTNNNKDQIHQFLFNNINTHKIIDNDVFIRRKYLKWIMWSTPVFLYAKVEIRETDLNKSIIYIRYSSIVFPILINFIYMMYYLIFNPSVDSNIVAMSIFLVLIFYYLTGLIERAALKRKIEKIIRLDDSYCYFA